MYSPPNAQSYLPLFEIDMEEFLRYALDKFLVFAWLVFAIVIAIIVIPCVWISRVFAWIAEQLIDRFDKKCKSFFGFWEEF